MKMNLPDDIKARIERDFSDNGEKSLVIKILSDLDVKERDRVIRCILYASGGSLDRLRKLWLLAKTDYRDVILAGEYEFPSGERVRNFNESFTT